jgi:AcrR family transcriptional regulator
LGQDDVSSPRRGRDPARERIAAAMVEVVAGHGFAAVDIATVCERAEVGRAHFDRCFADLEDCFLVLHDEVMEELCSRVNTVCDGREAWHDRIWAAGMAAMRYLQEDPDRASFLVVAINGAGSGAQSRRDRIVQRIADFLDGGRGEVEGERPMSRCTAEIAAGAVYGTILAKVESGSIERGEEFLPELIYLATMPYLGARAAEDELLVQPLR